MPLPPELEPQSHPLVMDLVAEAGLDISEWGGNAANPKFCYEWCFVSPTTVVLNLWHDLLTEADGFIVQNLNYRKHAEDLEQRGFPSISKKRAQRMDEAIQTAVRNHLPVRVIINQGTRRDFDDPSKQKSTVKGRLLDQVSWAVTEYDWKTGRCVITRGAQPSPFADQFSFAIDSDNAPRTCIVQGKVFVRSPSVRMSVLNRANGKCEYCNCPGFKTKDGVIFLETHHVVALADGGPDKESNVAALCPNHHRQAHYGEIAPEMQQDLLSTIKAKLTGVYP